MPVAQVGAQLKLPLREYHKYDYQKQTNSTNRRTVTEITVNACTLHTDTVELAQLKKKKTLADYDTIELIYQWNLANSLRLLTTIDILVKVIKTGREGERQRDREIERVRAKIPQRIRN